MKLLRLPSEWRIVPLSSIADVQTGLALGKPATRDSIRLPYLRVANVQDGFFDLTEIKEVEIERTQVSRFSLQPGDVLLTEGGDSDKLGRGNVWNGEIPICLHQNHVFVVRPHPALLPAFLSGLTSSDYGRAYFQSCSKQSTNLASINSTQLKEFPVPLPPLDEQHSINAVLAAWDRSIRTLSALIVAKLRFKQGLMQKLLTGQMRLRIFEQEPWGVCPLGSLLTESRVVGSSGAAARKLTVRWYGNGVCPKNDVRPGSGATQYYIRRSGQFVYSKIDFLKGAFGIVPPELDGYETTLDLPAFDITADIDAQWLLLFVTRQEFYCKQQGLARGGRKAPRVQTADFLNVRIPVPSKREQESIAAIIGTLNRNIELLRQELAAVKQQKKGLMQKLLTGQVRVKP